MYDCDKHDCYFCMHKVAAERVDYIMPEVVNKHKKWSEKEIQLLSDNINLKTIELMPLFKKRTFDSIRVVKNKLIRNAIQAK